MKSAVPAALRHRALRRLWLTDPVFANLDGLVDYAEDFTDAATVVPGMKTAYRLGRGFLPDVPEPAVETATAEAPEAGDTAAAAPEETAAAPEEASPTDATADDSVGQDAAADPGRPADSAEDRAGEQSAAAPDERPARTRGMRFSFGA